MSLGQNYSGIQCQVKQENPDITTNPIDRKNYSALKHFETHNARQKPDDKSQSFGIRHGSIRFIT